MSGARFSLLEHFDGKGGEPVAKSEDEGGFTISDKRHFTSEGEVREETAGPARQEPTSPAADAGASPQDKGPSDAEERIDFPSYVLTYYTQGLVLLGEVPNPYTNKKEENLDAARHTIDILTLLQEKTRGNLDREEQQLLDSVLYELRMKFMAKTDLIKL
jgi:hypothetical protein